MNKLENRLLIYIPPELKRKAKAKAALECISMSAVISDLTKQWVEGKIPTPQVKEGKPTTKSLGKIGKKK